MDLMRPSGGRVNLQQTKRRATVALQGQVENSPRCLGRSIEKAYKCLRINLSLFWITEGYPSVPYHCISTDAVPHPGILRIRNAALGSEAPLILQNEKSHHMSQTDGYSMNKKDVIYRRNKGKRAGLTRYSVIPSYSYTMKSRNI